MKKLENTIKNKQKFFAQYWGQQVLCFRKEEEPIIYVGADDFSLGKAKEGDFLLLKPISSITDEDAIMWWCIDQGALFPQDFTFNGFELSHDSEICWIKVKNKKLPPISTPALQFCIKNIEAKVMDYLRSKGYALPYMNLSVEDMINYGWIKLTE